VNKPRIAIVTDDPGWHGRRLRAALAGRGYAARTVSLTACDLDLSGAGARVRLRGFGAPGPVGVFVRGVPGGTLEQIIARLDLLHLLQLQGTVVYNAARVIERTVDKAMTSALLRMAGIPTPPTWVCESPARARALATAAIARGARLVLKPLFGSQGNGLRLVERVEDVLVEPPAGGVYYLQRFVERAPGPWCDYRVFVIDGRARAAMRRSAGHWITNRARGARCEAAALQAQPRALAEAAVRAVQADYAGVDLMCDAAGCWQVIEVNGVPAWYGLQRATGIDIGAQLADHFVARIAAAGVLGAVP